MNEDIKRIGEQLNNNNKLYFTILIGHYNQSENKLLLPLDQANTGSKKFLEYIQKAITQYNADFVIVQIFKFAKIDFRKNPEFTEKIILKKEENTTANQFNGFGNLENLYKDGLQGFISDKVTLSTLQAEANRLNNDSLSLKQENTNLISKIENLKADKDQLTDKIRNLQWTIDDLKRHYEAGKDFNQKLEGLLGVAGTIGANILGIDKEKLLGLMGNLNTSAISGNSPQENKIAINDNKNDATFNLQDEEKKESYELKNAIQVWLEKAIETNSKQNALQIMNSVYLVFSFFATDLSNLNKITSYVSELENTIEIKKD